MERDQEALDLIIDIGLYMTMFAAGLCVAVVIMEYFENEKPFHVYRTPWPYRGSSGRASRVGEPGFSAE
jgi:hypothetical protein